MAEDEVHIVQSQALEAGLHHVSCLCAVLVGEVMLLRMDHVQLKVDTLGEDGGAPPRGLSIRVEGSGFRV